MTRVRGLCLDLGDGGDSSALGVGGEKLIVENANVCRDDTVRSCEEGKYRAISSDEIGTTDAVDTVSTRSQSTMESRF